MRTLSSKKCVITETDAEFEIEINFPICKQSFNKGHAVFFGLLIAFIIPIHGVQKKLCTNFTCD